MSLKNWLRKKTAWLGSGESEQEVNHQDAGAPATFAHDSIAEVPAPAPVVAPPVVAPPLMQTPPVVSKAIPAAIPTVAPPPVVRVRPPEPEPVAPPPPPENLPPLKVFVKTGTYYATCPHCESTFNLQQRLSDPRYKRAGTYLTCPKCEQGVATPTAADLKPRR